MKGEFYKMEYEAWDEGTELLTLEQEAALLRICHLMYRRRGPVLANPVLLGRIWRCHPNKARALLDALIAAGKLTQDGEHVTNARVTQELDARETRSRQARDAGQTGGRQSQENRRNSLKNNDPDQAKAQGRLKLEEKIREEVEDIKTPPTPPRGGGVVVPLERYAFEHQFVRLTPNAWSELTSAFTEPGFPLRAEILGMMPLLRRIRGPDGRGNWYEVMVRNLSSKHRRFVLARQAAQAKAEAEASRPERRPTGYVC